MNKFDEGLTYFIYKNRDEYDDKKKFFFMDLRNAIKITDTVSKLIIYTGIYDCYKILKIDEIIKSNLNILTEYKHVEWVNDICWHIFKTVESSFDSLPFRLIKLFTNIELEMYIFDVIYNTLNHTNTDGFLNFIEEKNYYINDESNFVETILDLNLDESVDDEIQSQDE